MSKKDKTESSQFQVYHNRLCMCVWRCLASLPRHVCEPPQMCLLQILPNTRVLWPERRATQHSRFNAISSHSGHTNTSANQSSGWKMLIVETAAGCSRLMHHASCFCKAGGGCRYLPQQKFSPALSEPWQWGEALGTLNLMILSHLDDFGLLHQFIS